MLSELGLTGLKDPRLFEVAVARDLVIVTLDSDFVALATKYMEAQRDFPGVMKVRSARAPFTQLLVNLEELAKTTPSGGMRGMVQYVPV